MKSKIFITYAVIILAGTFGFLSVTKASTIIAEQNFITGTYTTTTALKQTLGNNLSGDFVDIVVKGKWSTAQMDLQIYECQSSSICTSTSTLLYDTGNVSAPSSTASIKTLTAAQNFYSNFSFDPSKYYAFFIWGGTGNPSFTMSGHTNSYSDKYPVGQCTVYSGNNDACGTLNDLFFIIDVNNAQPTGYYNRFSMSTSSASEINYNLKSGNSVNISYSCPDTSFNIFGADFGKMSCQTISFMFTPHSFSTNLILDKMTEAQTIFPFSVPMTILNSVASDTQTSTVPTTLSIPLPHGINAVVLTSSTMQDLIGVENKNTLFTLITSFVWLIVAIIMFKTIA